MNEVSRDRVFFETRHFRSHRYRDQYRDQESLGTEGLGTKTAHLWDVDPLDDSFTDKNFEVKKEDKDTMD